MEDGVQMEKPQPAGGDVVVYANVRDPEAKLRLRQLLDDLPGERVTPPYTKSSRRLGRRTVG